MEGVNRVRDLSRSRCREVFEGRFAAERMASDYVDVYKQLIDSDVEGNSNQPVNAAACSRHSINDHHR